MPLTAVRIAVSLPINGRIAGTAAEIECAFSAMMTRSCGPSSAGSSVQRRRTTCSTSLQRSLMPLRCIAARWAPRATRLNIVYFVADIPNIRESQAGSNSLKRRRSGQIEHLLEFGDRVDLRAHRNVGHPLGNDLDDDRQAQRRALAPRPGDGAGDLPGLEDADGAAAEGLGGLDVVDAVFADFRRVDVGEGELHLVIHLIGALGLTDETEIGVVEEDHDEGDLVLRGDRQLLDEELEGVVADDADDLLGGVGELGAGAGRDLPAERPRLAANDVVARRVNLLELAGGDLVEADRGDELGVAAEARIDLGKDALRLDRHVVEIGSPLHRALALRDLGNPRVEAAEPAVERGLARRRDERLERIAGIRDDAEIGAEDAADLHRLDVDMDEFPAARIDRGTAGVPIGPAITDAEDEVAVEEI